MRGLWVGAVGLTFGILCLVGCIASDATVFGNPNTLSRSNLPGEAGAAVTPISTTCGGATFDGGCPTFDNDIYPYLTPNGKWRCSDPTCHGGGATSPSLTCDTPDNCFASLEAIPPINGLPYIDAGAGDPNGSAMLCSLQGACGDKMPKPPGQDPTPDDLCIVQAWLKCGAPR